MAPPTTRAAATDASSTATAGGLTVTLTVSPAHLPPGGAVHVTISAHETSGTGPLAYQVSYGDGTTDQAPVPLFCRTTPAPESDSWVLSHTYAAAGNYTLSATVTANCTADRATTAVTVGAG